MTTYTLHLPRDARPGDPTALDESELVKDAFSWGAFFFTFLWFFVHRLWLAGFAVLVGLIAFGGILRLLGVAPFAAGVAHLLVLLLIGLEANTLRRWTYARHGRPAVDVVTAAGSDEAEAKAFGRWLQQPETPRPPSRISGPAGGRPGDRRPDAVIGLFPDAERPL
jgi:Protein of unknown function (DUF2628)